MRTIRQVIVHHTAGPSTETVATIRRYHRTRGFHDIGYHWLVRELYKGGPWVVEAGRPEYQVGAHDADENAESIGIAIAGDYSEVAVPSSAWDVLVTLVADRCTHYGLEAGDISGHSDHEPASTPTLCPGFSARELRREVGRRLARWVKAA